MSIVISILREKEWLESQFQLHHGSLLYFAKDLTGNREQAEDIVAETFFSLWNKRYTFHEEYNIKAWLFKVTRNACLNWLKHAQRKTTAQKELLYLAQKDEDHIQSKMVKAELISSIVKQIEKLPPRAKKILELLFFEGLNTTETALRLNITVDTVRVQKARALHALKKAAGGE